MTQTRLRTLTALGLAACCGALASSCSAPPRMDANAGPPFKAAASRPARQIVQLDFGRGAAFVTCPLAACPEVTPKTLANKVPLPLLAPRALDVGASLDPGEALVEAESRWLNQPEPVAPARPTAGETSQGPARNRRVEIDFEREAGDL